MVHPVHTSHAWPRVPLAVAIAVVLAIAVLAIPLKVRCGAPGLACATAVDARANVHFYYEVEPLGVYIAETFTDSNIRLYYQSGQDLEKVR
jgi:anti-sigma-K factor RskA